MKNVPPGKKRNLPSDLGRKFGVELARLCDDAEITRMPLHPRCKTCAFRAGSIPNGCEATVMDALKCAMEGLPFLCHERKGHACSGWMTMRADESFKVAWPWSNNDSPDAASGEQPKEKT